MEVMIFGDMGSAHIPRNRYPLRITWKINSSFHDELERRNENCWKRAKVLLKERIDYKNLLQKRHQPLWMRRKAI